MSSKISALDPLTTAADADLLIAVDVSDTTMAATGTDKKLTLASLRTLMEGTFLKGSTGASDEALLRADGTGGKTAQASLATIDDAGKITAPALSVTGLAELPHIHGSLAGDIYVHVKNTTAGVLTKGTPVYATGHVGAGSSTVEVAAAESGNPAKMKAIGVLKQDLAVNAEGDAIIIG